MVIPTDKGKGRAVSHRVRAESKTKRQQKTKLHRPTPQKSRGTKEKVERRPWLKALEMETPFPTWLLEKYRTLSKTDSRQTANTIKRREQAKKARGFRRTLIRCKRRNAKKKRSSTSDATTGVTTQGLTKNNYELMKCPACAALVWKGEALRAGNRSTKTFSLCCQQGRVKLPAIPEPPKLLQELLQSPSFRENIRVYNSMLSFTSMGAQVDHAVTGAPGPYTYRIHGQNVHQIGSLLPVDGAPPQFVQLYIYDTANEVQNRMNAMTRRGGKLKIQPKIVEELIQMLDSNNHLARTFRHARDRYESGNTEEFNIRLVSQNHRGRQYDLPSGEEIGGLIVGDLAMTSGERDVVLEFKSSSLQRISDRHSLFMSLQYPLLFPYGDSGYHEKIPYTQSQSANKVKRKYMTMREYYAYQIQTRQSEGMTIIRGGRLLHQYIVDAYTQTEQERLRFLRLNQKKLRADLYNSVCDAVDRGDTDARTVGTRVILPSSFTAGPRYMAEKYHDAMAICKCYGNPNLFITVTANPSWVEIAEHLQAYGGESANSRPDLECRIFKLKLDEMMLDFNKGVFFPKLKAAVYTIEFQKRGLPHAHILLWFQGSRREITAATVEQFISAEIPDKETDREGYDLVRQHMMHGPCGTMRKSSPCMENGECSKNYPKPYSQETTIDKSGFVNYRRREDDTKFVLKGEHKLDNRYVVPHNLNLLKKYKAHINVEWCCTSTAIKYLFKYVNKGADKATIVIENSKVKGSESRASKKGKTDADEINTYLDCRYVSACEATWRLFAFHIHHHRPSVMRLPIHLPNQQRLLFDQTADLSGVITRGGIEITMLTGWMETNKTNEEARELTYVEFPSRFVWNSSDKTWTPRQKQESIGRISYIHPGAGDVYYLRILVHKIRGATSFEDILTVAGVLYATFKEACYAMGLLDDDKEWHDAIKEASHWAMAFQLRRLFVTLLIYCEVSDPEKLWNNTWKFLAEDILHSKRKEFNFPGLQLKESELQQYTLIHLQQLLKENDKSLTEFPNMPLPDKTILRDINNNVLRQEMQFDTVKEMEEHQRMFPLLNAEQKTVYHEVLDSVDKQSGKLFFVYGPGGTGKTFLYKTLIAKLRASEKIVIPVASAGIAALLLPGGRTAHSRFKIPINLHEGSTCQVQPGTMLAGLLTKADLIIWDEAPMAHKHAFEAVDRTLRDLLSMEDEAAAEKTFGGKTVLLGGDFRQILPVVPQGSRQDTVLASISRSYLWKSCHVYNLTTNMRLKQEDKDFAEWILQVGNGVASRADTCSPSSSESEAIIVDKSLMLRQTANYLLEITNAAYPNFLQNYQSHEYLRARAILTPRNETVHEINAYLLSNIPSEMKEYLSSDSIEQEATEGDEDDDDPTSDYTVEYLNSLEFPGLPHHRLCLKIGVPVMLLRNLDQKHGMCNGTRLVITRLGNRVIEAEIITGTHVGEKVLIPRIQLTPNDITHPFTLRRRQFPIRICYAMTINKSQGQSLQQVALYLPNAVFTHGQLYVALSRVTSPKGLKIYDETGLSTKGEEEAVSNIVYREIFNNLSNIQGPSETIYTDSHNPTNSVSMEHDSHREPEPHGTSNDTKMNTEGYGRSIYKEPIK